MTPLQVFLINLLKARGYSAAYSVDIVVDNASSTMENLPQSKNSQSLPASTPSNSSNHSSTRWGTDASSPLRPIEVNPSLRATHEVAAASTQRRCPMVSYKNSSPACPIRKLSPNLHPDADSRPFHSAELRMEERATPRKLEGNSTMNRPPLSPRKISGRSLVPGSASGCDCDNMKGPCLRPSTKDLAGPQPPVRLLSNQQASPLIQTPELAASAIKEGVPHLLGNRQAYGPTRGLSHTLLGIDSTEQAPICPIRRPSAQSNDSVNNGRCYQEKYRLNQDIDLSQGKKDIVVLPPTPEKQFLDDHSIAKKTPKEPPKKCKEGCSSSYPQRFSRHSYY